MESEHQVIKTTCSSHCGGRCSLKVHVRNGVIERIEADDSDKPRILPCVRGRAYRQRVYDPGRLKYPMKRVGERGEGKFERISWDEALDKVVSELNRVRTNFGPTSLTFLGGGGDHSHLHMFYLMQNLLEMTGGFTATWGALL